ncbi:MAG: 3-dehydroquinate synthase, partial [Fimbriimonadales bacterium]
LKASPEVLLSRIQDPTTRPLLSDAPTPHEALQQITQAREPLYQESDWVLETEGRSIDSLVEELSLLANPSAETPLRVPVLAETPSAYEVLIGLGLRAQFAARILEVLRPTRVALLSHPVLRAWVEPIAQQLNSAGVPTTLVMMPAGERYKTLRQVQRIYSELLRMGLDRSGLVVVVGGGVLGDMGGFVSATYMRGVPFVQIPTTLLAQVDSSVGGKVGVDLAEGKNLVGAFYQPKRVLIDPELLRTLPPRHWRNGLAEMLKYGIALQHGLWYRLEAMLELSLFKKRDLAQWTLPIARCVQIKAQIVSEDERDVSGRRALLNFGHTVGHAVEAVLGYREWLHGEAISAGMVAETRVGVKLGITPVEALEALVDLLRRAGLPTHLPNLSVDALMEAMRHDKKRKGDQLGMVLLEGLGRARFVDAVPPEVVREALQECGAHS